MDEQEPLDPETGMEDDEDELSPEEAEARISDFIAQADLLPGPSSETLVAEAWAIVERAWDEVTDLLGTHPVNKVIGAMLHASRLSREAIPVTREYWIASATTTLLSGQIPPGGRRSDDD